MNALGWRVNALIGDAGGVLLVLANQHTTSMTKSPFRKCDHCGTNENARKHEGDLQRRAWTAHPTTRKLSCPDCSDKGREEDRQALALIRANKDLLERRLLAEPVVAYAKTPKWAPAYITQYRSIKDKYPDAVLLFRIGDVYSAIGHCALQLERELGLKLKTLKGTSPAMHTASFPFHALDTYLPRLVRAGLRVAICDQLEGPPVPGIVCDPAERYLAIDRKQTENRLRDIIGVLKRHGVYCAANATEQETSAADANWTRNLEAIQREMALRQVAVCKHGSLRFTLVKTECNMRYTSIAQVLSAYTRNATTKFWCYRPIMGHAPKHAIGNFSTPKYEKMALRFAEENAATAANQPMPAVREHFADHLEQVKEHLGVSEPEAHYLAAAPTLSLLERKTAMVIAAVHGVQNGAERWAQRRDRGLTDAEMLDAFNEEAGNGYLGSFWGECSFECRPGLLRWSYGDSGEHELKGAQLVRELRMALLIGQPVNELQPTLF